MQTSALLFTQTTEQSLNIIKLRNSNNAITVILRAAKLNTMY